jgi:hypothetical protein
MADLANYGDRYVEIGLRAQGSRLRAQGSGSGLRAQGFRVRERFGGQLKENTC